jgi:hypothetical protein
MEAGLMEMEMVTGYVIVYVKTPGVTALGNVLPKVLRMAPRDQIGQVREIEVRNL